MGNPYSMVFRKEPALIVSRAAQEDNVINDFFERFVVENY